MISVRTLCFQYGKSPLLFNGMDFTLPDGRIIGLLGKNGAGKTTLLKLLSGLAFPKTGEIVADHYRPGNRHPEFLQDLFFLTEDTWLPSTDAHTMVGLYAAFYPGFDEALFYTTLKSFEVRPDQPLSRASQGQKKKVLIAFALACNTRYVFFDEPTNGLDIPSKSTFRSLLASAFHEERTFILSTHQVRDLQHLIDWTLILENGRILINRSLDELSQQLTFGHSFSAPPDDCLYVCPGETGNAYIRPNPHGNPGNVDLETLFTGMLAVPEKLFSHLQPESR